MVHKPVLFAESYFVCKDSSSNSLTGQFIKDFLDDRFAGFSPGLCVSALKNYPRSPVAAGQRLILLWGVHRIHFSASKGYDFRINAHSTQ